jgi:actinin alpha
METQIKAFSRWANKYLARRELSILNITTELSDGVKFINLIEILTNETITQNWHSAPTSQAQMHENCTIALNYLTNVRKFRLLGVTADHIVENNVKITLGLVFTLIMKFSVEDISVEEATARDALIIWCKKNTNGYENVNITNFTSSWANGFAFCALIDHFRPDILRFDTLNLGDHAGTATRAFDACRALGIPVLLDANDICDISPDEKSIIAQCAEFFHFFSRQLSDAPMA